MYATRLIRASSVVVVLWLLLASCAHSSFTDARRMVAKSHLKAGRWVPAFRLLEADLLSSDKASKDWGTAMLKQYPQFAPGLIAELKAEVEAVKTPSGAVSVKQQMEAIRKTGITDPSHVAALSAKLEQAVLEGNRSGRLAFTLADQLTEFPSLAAPTTMTRIFERSLQALAEKGSVPSTELVRGTFAYVKAKGPASSEFQQLAHALPHIAFSKSQLETIVQELYPAFADQTSQSLTVVVHLKTEPPRRFLEEDVASLLRRRSALLPIVRAPQEGAVSVLVRELQYEEQQEPERTQTIVIDSLQIDPVIATLTMPRGASMVFEHTQGSAEIRWAFEVVASRDGQTIYERLLRDTVRRTYSFCSNMRVQNVFGGVQAAMAYPNSQVKALCESGQQPVRALDLRAEVTQRLADEIAAIPVIAMAIARSH